MVALDLKMKYIALYNDAEQKTNKKKAQTEVMEKRKDNQIQNRHNTHTQIHDGSNNKHVQTHLQQTRKAIKQTVCCWTFFSSKRR